MSKPEPKVTGIGGIFFKSNDPKQTREWYGENLGLALDPYGSAFEFRNANRPDEINYLRWSPFEAQTDYFQPSEKSFMINYRVQNIEALVEKLKANGVQASTLADILNRFSLIGSGNAEIRLDLEDGAGNVGVSVDVKVLCMQEETNLPV